MTENCSHPSKEELNAYSLGQLPEDVAVAIDSHISECQTCCETIVGLSSEDTFAALLLESEKSKAANPLGHKDVAHSVAAAQDLPAVLASHPRYEILSLVGRGGMGDVYKARHRKMDRTVALKVINRQVVRKQEAIDRFHREVKTAAKLSHPNIVTSHDADQAGEFHFLAMEYVDGVDLARTIRQRGALPVQEACEYIRQAASGLQYAHARGMVHRDIKPHNLIVTKDGTVKILDFGLASLAPATVLEGDACDSQADLTMAGAIMGTPDFISPEQASDARQADTRSDIYSLGATLYFLLSGRVPFDDGSVMHKLKSHAELEPESLSLLRGDVPEDLVVVVSKMMAKDPAKRYQSAEEVAAALSEFGTQTSLAEPPKGRGSSFLKWTAGMAFCAAAAAALCMFLFGPHDPEADYQQMSQFMKTGASQEPVDDIMARLLRTEEGRKYLRKLDAEHPKLAYTSGDFARGYNAVVILAYDDRITGVRNPELMLKGWSPTTTGMATRNIVRAFELESVRFDNAGDETCKTIMRYETPENPKLTLGLKPNAIYQAEIRLNDFIEGKKSIIDLFAGGEFQKDLSMQGIAEDALETSTKSGRDLADGNISLPTYTPKAPVIELRWAYNKHIPGVTKPQNQGNYFDKKFFAQTPVLTLTPDNVDVAAHMKGKLSATGDLLLHWVEIELNQQTVKTLDSQLKRVRIDQDESEKLEYITLLIDGKEGFSVPAQEGEIGQTLISPYYKTHSEAQRVVKALHELPVDSGVASQFPQEVELYWKRENEISDTPILRLSSKDVAAVCLGSELHSVDEQVPPPFASISLKNRVAASLEREIANLGDDEDWTHICLVIDGAGGSEIEISAMGNRTVVDVRSPSYETEQQARRLASFLEPKQKAPHPSLVKDRPPVVELRLASLLDDGTYDYASEPLVTLTERNAAVTTLDRGKDWTVIFTIAKEAKALLERTIAERKKHGSKWDHVALIIDGQAHDWSPLEPGTNRRLFRSRAFRTFEEVRRIKKSLRSGVATRNAADGLSNEYERFQGL